MNEELIERLRDKWQHSEEDCYAAADALEAAEARAVEAERQLAAAREALALFACDCAPKIECADPSNCRNSIARAVLSDAPAPVSEP